MNTVLTILLGILVFGFLIFIHELGHFIAAKWAGMRVYEFAMGMGPTLFSVTRGETKYALRLFPIGGFVALEGENEENDGEQFVSSVPVGKRMVVMVAGAVMNLVLGFVILCILTVQQGAVGSTVVARFEDGAVSSQHLQVGDEIIRINGHRVRTNNDLEYYFMREQDSVMDMEVRRSRVEEPLQLQVPFRMDTVDGDESLQFIHMDFWIQGQPLTVWNTITYSANWTVSVARQIWGSLADLITGRFGIKQMSGPVGVTQAIGQATSAGIRPLLRMVSFITVNLGVFNLLPFPALDGGRLLFMLVEVVRRKPLNPKYEGYVHAAGFLLLIALMITVTFNDVIRLFAK